MAKRLLLTLLALFGLAAQVAPAQAGVSERAASALVLAAENAVAKVAVAGSPAPRAIPPVVGLRIERLLPATPAPVIATVLIGIDRARQ